jgi:hypothetical protein
MFQKKVLQLQHFGRRVCGVLYDGLHLNHVRKLFLQNLVKCIESGIYLLPAVIGITVRIEAFGIGNV